MYISKIHIKGFRNFRDQEIVFNDGINVIIGHNNAGKTNLLQALALVIDHKKSKKLDIDDFHKSTDLSDIKKNPPKITISLSICQSQKEDPHSDDLVTVSNWLTKLEPPYEALLTYEFFLPETELENYRKALANIGDSKEAWQIIKQDFIRLYTYKIFGGEPNLRNVADNESLQKFDFQFLDAIRDVERDMFSGKNALLKEVLDFFMDYEIKTSNKTPEEKEEELKKKKTDFSENADILIQDLQSRMSRGKEEILAYAKETGASFNQNQLDFDGNLSDTEFFSALRLVIEHSTGIKIPVTHNGLGYNNLIFMSLLLAKMQVDSDSHYLGSNAKVFPMLAIEEPEAHLHPAMQYKFLKFLKENEGAHEKARQIFVTTHSTQITSAVLLDQIICLNYDGNEIKVGYPGKVFPDEKSKAYVQRFLDSTRSDMLFAKRIILVEGIAEQLLLPILAKYIEKSLEDEHIAVINVGGRHFDCFLHLFDTKNPNTLPQKVACLTDRDPERKCKSKSNYKQCYPFEYNLDSSKFD